MKHYLFWMLVAALSISGCDEAVTSFHIPESYTGWVGVHYGEASCRTYRQAGPSSVISVDEGGRACSPLHESPSGRLAFYYYVDDSGERVGELKSGEWGQDPDEVSIWGVTMDCFFVGTEEAFRQPWPGPEERICP